ncbi:MAG: dephospho-CoA kinase [Alistipes sp.]|nr:dephospho-CoA kinase [Alistipes sp.]MBQ5923952.1 dephospho-CoA kinase [Alistipes sp.]
MYKVGITGGIGSGKSTVCDILAEAGVAVYNSDIRAKELMTGSESLRASLIERFGAEVYTAEGLNRSYLAERVFANAEELSALNAIVHPAVMADFAEWAEAQEGDYVVLESAILFEAHLEDKVDAIVSVMAPEALRVERAIARDGASRESIEARIRSQMSDDERSDRSKYAIVNIDIEELREDVEQLHRRLSYDSRAKHD